MNARQILINAIVVVVLLLIGGGVLYEVYESHNYVSTTNASVTVPSITVSALSAVQVASIPVSIGQRVSPGETLVALAQTGAGGAAALGAPVRGTTRTAKGKTAAASSSGTSATQSTGASVSSTSDASGTTGGKVASPVTGVVTALTATPGETVFPGQPLLTLTQPQNASIVANVPETAIRNVKVGQSVNVTIDAYPGTTFTGTVSAIQPATQASLSLFPASALSGTFTKVTQLVPVMVRINTQGYQMYNGLSAEIRIQTGNGGL